MGAFAHFHAHACSCEQGTPATGHSAVDEELLPAIPFHKQGLSKDNWQGWSGWLAGAWLAAIAGWSGWLAGWELTARLVWLACNLAWLHGRCCEQMRANAWAHQRMHLLQIAVPAFVAARMVASGDPDELLTMAVDESSN